MFYSWATTCCGADPISRLTKFPADENFDSKPSFLSRRRLDCSARERPRDSTDAGRTSSHGGMQFSRLRRPEASISKPRNLERHQYRTRAINGIWQEFQMASCGRLRNFHGELCLSTMVTAAVRCDRCDDLAASDFLHREFGRARQGSQSGLLVNGPEPGRGNCGGLAAG